MTHEQFSPLLRDDIADRIRQCVDELELPSDALLLQGFFDMQRQCERQRLSIAHEEDKVFAEGYAALARILLTGEDLRGQPDEDYFNRFRNKGERRHV